MVKGVNKRVIEVNQTGNKFFEKIVFYVSPEYGQLSTGELKKATEGFAFTLRESMEANSVPPLRKRYRLKKRRFFLLSGVTVALLVALVLTITKIL